jgi:hypothetical protein
MWRRVLQDPGCPPLRKYSDAYARQRTETAACRA